MTALVKAHPNMLPSRRHKSLARQLDVIASLFDVDAVVRVAFLVDSNLDAAGLDGRDEFVSGFQFIAPFAGFTGDTEYVYVPDRSE
jgi:hypothetical protein